MKMKMPNATKATKHQLRRHIREKLKEMHPDELERQSIAIAVQLLENTSYLKDSQGISVYLNMPSGEVATGPILRRLAQWNKAIYVPKIIGSKSQDMKMLKVESIDEIASFAMVRVGL